MQEAMQIDRDYAQSDSSLGGPNLDEIIASRLGLRSDSAIGSMVVLTAKQIFGYREARRLMTALEGFRGADAFDAMESLAGIKVEATGLEVVPEQGAALLVTNHPTGAPDGVALWAAIKAKRRDISFISSTEAVSFLQGVDDFIIPVDLSKSSEGGRNTRRLGHAILRAVKQGRLIIVTPAAQITARPNGIEPHWQSGYAEIAARFKLPVIAAHISARNSRAYYAAGRISKPLQELLVFRQLINRQGKPLKLSFDRELHTIQNTAEIEDFNVRIRRRVFEVGSAHG